ncbi:undecaprenyl-phosphate galactose phosphotransferase WbaP [Pectinatus haikarae]|uniref:undecaprenyl-phosphate galactose phosphotransferase WbaP n=1 Tax=Pectinatus haikarae TaxID=349096 RepID=UPI001E4B8435|nr:undecaprenyl-phosphate galactose phosphotransferase WbaP [Pectinatus haikarae]
MKCEKIKVTNMDHTASYIMPLLLLAADYLAILSAQKVAIYLRQHIGVFSVYHFMPNVPNLYFYFLVPAVFIAFLYNSHIYVNRMPFWEVIQKVFYAAVLSMMVCITMMYFGHIAGGVSRIYVALLGVITFVFLCVFRYCIKKILFRFNILLEPVIIIGAGKTAELIVGQFGNDTGFGVKIIGFIDDAPVSEKLPERYPILGGFNEAEEIIKTTKVKTVLIAAPGLKKDSLLTLVNRIQPLVKDLAFVPDLIGAPVGNMEIQRLYDAKIMMLRVRNNMSRWYNKVLKKIFDLTVGLLCLPLIILISIVIIVCIYMESPGPVIFTHRRVGKNGRMFPCYKFRTMVMNAQEVLEKSLEKDPELQKKWELAFKLKNDPRITRVGKFLRKTSLDELPQIINVFLGQMSLVGPRPIITKEVERYGEYIHDYYLVPPGITGLWQVSGRSDTTYAERVEMDTWYVRNWSVWIDIVLLYKTILAVFFQKGAY